VLIGGDFHTIDGWTTVGLGALSSTGTGVDPRFFVYGYGVTNIATQSNGKIVVAGDVTSVGFGNDKIKRRGIARINPDGSPDPTFDALLDGDVDALAQDAAGNLLVGGLFEEVGGLSRTGLARLDADGRVDATFSPRLRSYTSGGGLVHDIHALPDGKIVISGSFDHVNDQPVQGFARLNADGTLDRSFQPDNVAPTFESGGETYTYGVDSSAVLSDGSIVLLFHPQQQGGNTYGALLLRVRSDGRTDPSFNVTVTDLVEDAWVRAISVLPDGALVIGGDFQDVNGESVDNLARIDSSGVVDGNFRPDISFAYGRDGTVEAIAPYAGDLFIGGDFGVVKLNDPTPGPVSNLKAVTRGKLTRITWSPPVKGHPVTDYQWRVKAPRGKYGKWVATTTASPQLTLKNAGKSLWVVEVRAVAGTTQGIGATVQYRS
jgi:uncharacterized delta-60 repeat protein